MTTLLLFEAVDELLEKPAKSKSRNDLAYDSQLNPPRSFLQSLKAFLHVGLKFRDEPASEEKQGRTGPCFIDVGVATLPHRLSDPATFLWSTS